MAAVIVCQPAKIDAAASFNQKEYKKEVLQLPEPPLEGRIHRILNKKRNARNTRAIIQNLQATVDSQRSEINYLDDHLQQTEGCVRVLQARLLNERREHEGFKEITDKENRKNAGNVRRIADLEIKENHDKKEIERLEQAWKETINEFKKSEEDKEALSDMLKSLRKEGCKVTRTLKDERAQNDRHLDRIAELNTDIIKLRGNLRVEKLGHIQELNDVMCEKQKVERSLSLQQIKQMTLIGKSTALQSEVDGYKLLQQTIMTEFDNFEGEKKTLKDTIRTLKKAKFNRGKLLKEEKETNRELKQTIEELNDELAKSQSEIMEVKKDIMEVKKDHASDIDDLNRLVMFQRKENDKLREKLKYSGIRGGFRRVCRSVRRFVRRLID